MGIQVQELTLNKKCYEKEFIDFEFNGKHISEFGMVAVFDGDRHTFAATPDFENETTEINGAAGQLFWGTKVKSKKMTFSLATDGMTEQQVNAFKYHFKPGQYGKFIEDKLTHRYGYCRVSDVVEFKVVPFRKYINMLGTQVPINEYKGEASITFEFDDPYLYSTLSYIDKPLEELSYDERIDAIKTVHNNGVPLSSSWNKTIFVDPRNAVLGNGTLGTMILGLQEFVDIKQCHLGTDKCLDYDRDNDVSSLVTDSGHSDVGLNNPMIYYNPSTVRTPAKITIQFTPSFTPLTTTSEWKPIYFSNINDDINYTSLKLEEQMAAVPYNSILGSKILTGEYGPDYSQPEGERDIVMKIPAPFEEDFVYKFDYTTPNLIHSIHRVIQMAYNFHKSGNYAAVDLENSIREEVVHEKVSRWALSCLALIRKNETFCDKNDKLLDNTATLDISMLGYESKTYTGNWLAYFNVMMLLMLCENARRESDNEYVYDITQPDGTWAAFYPITIKLDGKESQTTIDFQYNAINDAFEIISYSGKEFCGDMILTPYFNLEGGDSIDENGQIISCHALQFVKNASIESFPLVKLEYDYTYL